MRGRSPSSHFEPEGARDVALDVLRRVFTQGAFASTALRSAFEKELPLSPADKGLATELVYGVLRRRGHLDRAIGRLGKRLKDLDPRMHDVLRLGAYQIMYLDRVPDHAAVSEAVEQAKRRVGARGAGQVNAILRRLASTPRELRLPPPVEIEKDPARHVADIGGLPHALADLLVRDLGAEEALAFAIASLEPARLTLRANRLKTTREMLALEVGGLPGSTPWAVRLPPRPGVLPSELPCVIEGRATPQDEASMRVVELLDPQPGERILDVCAAPGGKTTHMAEAMSDQGDVIAHDRLPSRLEEVDARARRLGLVSIRTARTLPPSDEGGFDRVLVDAPCSGLGTLRRHPEIRWRFSPDQIEALARTQRALLLEGGARVRRGGTLVYSVCTISRAEGPAAVGELPGFELTETLRTGPHLVDGEDGFFAAKLRRAD